MAKILVSLVSEQTVPNVELIKEFKTEIDEYLFIHTEKTIRELEWILKTTKIENYKLLNVNAFDVNDIENKLHDFNFGDNDYYLNITGGTKLMALIVDDFFRRMGAKIYYVTGYKKNYIKLFPFIGQRNFTLTTSLSLNEYLHSYGFEIKEGEVCNDLSFLNNFYHYFLKNPLDELFKILKPLQDKRTKGIKIQDIPDLQKLIHDLDFSIKDSENIKLNKSEVKLLTGDWFESFVYHNIKEELKLNDDEIGTGYTLMKENEDREKVSNEFDVLFVYEHKLYIVECKTSLFYEQKIIIESGNEKVEKIQNINILAETIYKSDALRAKFGLFANTTIITLSELFNETGQIKNNLKDLIERAKISRVKIISKENLNSDNFSYKKILS